MYVEGYKKIFKTVFQDFLNSIPISKSRLMQHAPFRKISQGRLDINTKLRIKQVTYECTVYSYVRMFD